MKIRMNLLLVAVLLSSSFLFGAEISVSPKGKISNLPAARDAVRALRASGEKGNIDVVIENGTYALDETLIFGLKDAAPAGAVTRYLAASGSRPIISGGRVIKKWKKTDLGGGNIWVAKVPWAKGNAFFHALFDGSELLQRAQSDAIIITNKGTGPYESKIEERINFSFPQGSLKQWKNLEDIELYGSPTVNWMVNFLPIASLNTETLEGRLAIPATYKMKGKFVVENCIDYLDKPGEWVLNSKEGRLYYWPKSGTPGNQIVAPMLDELVRVEGINDPSVEGTKDQQVSGIVFEGLQFSYADRQKWMPEDKGLQHDWDMWDKANGLIRFRGARNCTIKDCVFSDSGSDGVRLDLFCQNITVENSRFKNLGGTGILLAGYGPGKKDVNQNNTIQNNEITKVGSIFLHSPGIFIWQSGHNLIAHNHIHDLAYSGILVSGVRRRSFTPIFEKMGVKNPFGFWICDKDTREHSRSVRWEEITLGNIEDWASYEPYMHSRENVIEYNEVHDCLKLLHDGNCIYLSGNGKGNIVRYNVMYNHPEGAMIRTDDDSHGAILQGNLMFGTTGNTGITVKGLNTATGNIFVNCKLLTGLAGNTVDPECNLSRNVFYITNPDFTNGFHFGLKGVKEGLDYTIYYHEGGKGKELFKFQIQASATGLIDKHSLVADPMFVDPIHGDFSFKPGSPALTLGIQPLPLDTVQKMGTSRDPFLKRFSQGVPMNYKIEENKQDNTSKQLNL